MSIIEFIKAHQLNIMLFMSGICGVLAYLACVTGALSKKRRFILSLLELSAMLLLICDRFAYIYRGDVSSLGFWMVRICNFMVYFCSLLIPYAVTLYLRDLYRNEGGMETLPKRLDICKVLFVIGVALLIVTQFTGLYYTFDAQNQYQRAPGNVICYAMPFMIMFLLLSVLVQYRKRLSRAMTFALALNLIVPTAASVLQLFAYGVSLTNMTVVGMAIVLYIYALDDLNKSLERAQRSEIEAYREAEQREHTLFEETAEALVNAIDAKDVYTHGHSSRVAMYSRQIAKMAGMSDDECERVYFAALLHDVGKIGIADAIINKAGKLTDEEFAQIRRHPVLGNQILSSIQESPYLSIGAHYHHERFNGRGYPDGLEREEIPEIARIIAVADAYDAMTSNRSYRNAIPQHIVREELVKGAGIQFDPVFAKIMIRMIDQDTEYRMQESISGANASSASALRCDSLYHDSSAGIGVTRKKATIRLCSLPDDGIPEDQSLPTLIVYDALDANVHPGEEANPNLLYFEYALLRLDGQLLERGTRKAKVRFLDQESDLEPRDHDDPEHEQRYKVEAVRNRDHVYIRVAGESRVFEVILALPDTSRFVYIAISGEHCNVHNIFVETEATDTEPDAIPRIAGEISFISNCPEGDIPNIQIDGPRLSTSEGIPIRDGMTLSFHTVSYPTARLVWHCPYFILFSSSDGQVTGADFREYLLLRLDGESAESDEYADCEVRVERTADFEGWNTWVEKNKQGLDCTVRIRREGDRIAVDTENLGLAIHSVTTILDGAKDTFIAFTGDQCAITNIHVLGR